MKTLKRIISVLTLVLISVSFSFSQAENEYTSDLSDWKTYESINGIDIEYKIVEYHDNINSDHKELYIIRLTNTTSEDMLLKAKKDIWYDGKCHNCDVDDSEYKIEVQINSGDVLKGNPIDDINEQLIIYKSFLNFQGVPETTKFEFSNLTVKPL